MERINYLEMEIQNLKTKLRAHERELEELKQKQMPREPVETSDSIPFELNLYTTTKIGLLPKWAIERYSRQILLPDIGVEGQEKLCGAKVLVVGAGGLGCPAAAYLAGAGVGEIGIVDFDSVDLTNIHRQILHGEADQNVNKAESAADSLRKINSRIKISAHNVRVSTIGVLDMLPNYNVVIDCTDNVAARYLLGDACALLKLPLVSGSALKMEGQLSVYSYRAERNRKEQDSTLVGPCYRCVFPTPPPPETVGSCSTHGVAGPVPGMIGCLQALEAIKLITGHTHEKLLVGRMLIFDGEDMTFRTVRLRARNAQCKACTGKPKMEDLLDYETYCSARAKNENDGDLDLLPPGHRTTAPELVVLLNAPQLEGAEHNELVQRHLLVDVRSAEEYRMCHIGGTLNYPVDRLYGGDLARLVALVRQCCEQVIFICRRGNDSQIAARRVMEVIEEVHWHKVKDVIGGLHAWAKHVDPTFPIY